MRLLILTQYYPPEPHLIPHEIAKELILRGHEVTVITGFPNHPLGKIFDGYSQSFFKWDDVGGVRVLRVPLFPDHSLSVLRRIAAYLSFAFSALILAPILSPKVDAVFVYHTPSVAIPAWWLGSLRRIPFVFNVQDIYPESLSTLGMSKQRFLYRAVDSFVKFVYRKSTDITVISSGFKDNVISKGVPADKVHVIRTWADENIYRPVPMNEALSRQWGFAGRFNIVFAGNMGPPQGLWNVIDAAELLTDLPEVRFVLIGDGTTKDELMRSAFKKKLENVTFIPRQPVQLMPQFYSLADVLLVHLVDDPIFSITIPCKTQSYLACGKPLLMSIDGEAADLVRDAGAGLSVRPSDPSGLAQAVRNFFEMAPDDRNIMGERGVKFFKENLSLKVSVNEYERVFMNAITKFRNKLDKQKT